MKCAFIWACVIFGLIDGSFAQQQEKLKMPGLDVQNLMLGSWSTQVRYEPTPETPDGETGTGTEIWRRGPGGLSVIEEYRNNLRRNTALHEVWVNRDGSWRLAALQNALVHRGP